MERLVKNKYRDYRFKAKLWEFGVALVCVALACVALVCVVTVCVAPVCVAPVCGTGVCGTSVCGTGVCGTGVCGASVCCTSAAFFKLWSADHKWSSGSALVVLLDWTLVQKKTEK